MENAQAEVLVLKDRSSCGEEHS